MDKRKRKLVVNRGAKVEKTGGESKERGSGKERMRGAFEYFANLVSRVEITRVRIPPFEVYTLSSFLFTTWAAFSNLFLRDPLLQN